MDSSHYHEGQSLYIHAPDPELSTAENILRILRPDSKYTCLLYTSYLDPNTDRLRDGQDPQPLTLLSLGGKNYYSDGEAYARRCV